MGGGGGGGAPTGAAAGAGCRLPCAALSCSLPSPPLVRRARAVPSAAAAAHAARGCACWHGWCRDIVGFRAPFLETDETVHEVLAKNDFLYDRCVWGW